MKIAVDLDDTLSVVDRVTRAGGYIERNGLPFKLADKDAHALVNVYDWETGDVLKFIREGGITIFTDAEARKGAREVLAALKKAGHEIVVLTARQREWFVNPEKVSRDWLEKRHIPYDEIVADVPFAEKGNYCKEQGIPILIDDSYHSCMAAQELGVNAVLMVDKHNASRASGIRYRASDWRQVAGILNVLLATI